MIVVDTSALIAIVKLEAQAEACKLALAQADSTLVSAATLTEVLVVANGNGLTAQILALLDLLNLDVVALEERGARLAVDAYRKWGRRNHHASLNFGDCFAYALTKERACPLLFIGNDFSQTDIVAAI